MLSTIQYLSYNFLPPILNDFSLHCRPTKLSSKSTMLTYRLARSSQDSLTTWTPAPLSQWCGRVWTLLKLADKCWVPLIQLTLLPEPFVEITAFKLDVTSFMDLMPSNQPIRKSTCGSPKRNWSRGNQPQNNGSTNECLKTLNCKKNVCEKRAQSTIHEPEIVLQ